MGIATWEVFTRFKPRKVTYVNSIVSYIDILGFQELIETKKPGEISRILRILAESVKPDSHFPSQKIKFTKFSDTVIRSMPLEIQYPHYFVFELRRLLYAQMALIAEGVPIRGAVTIGDIVQSWGIVYGPAVVKAYRLESQKASFPRIVVDDDALVLIKPAIEEMQSGTELEGLLRKDGATTYLDYLSACQAEFNVPEQEYPMFLELHRDLIRKGLAKYQSNPRVLPKYEWLKKYHDETLEELFAGDIVPKHLHV